MTTYEIVKEAKEDFEKNKRIYDSALLKFVGVDGLDVYNCSVPFLYKGKQHIYGRVERRDEWANSFVRLFEATGKDEFTVVHDSPIWQLEDPYIAQIGDEMVFGGTHVRKNCGKVFTYYCDFYRGTPEYLTYYTTGPDNMKDIRVVQLANGKIGVFSRPKTASYSCIGFTVIDAIDGLSPRVVEEAPPLNVLHTGAWGGVNQAYLLSSSKIGCIAHYSYLDKDTTGAHITVYLNYAFVLDVPSRQSENCMIIGTKSCYPACPAKTSKLIDCAFSSGIVMRDDGKCDLYSGLGDTHQGRITIDYPFEGYGEIVDSLNF